MNKLARMVGILFLIPIFTFANQDNKPQIKQPEMKLLSVGYQINREPGPFFATYHNLLITNVGQVSGETNVEYYNQNFNHWLGLKKTWLQVDIKELNKIGFKENDKIQYLDFETKLVKEYTLKSKVHIALVKSDYYGESPEVLYNRTFYILLSDIPDASIKLDDRTNSDKMTGIAYKGNEYKLKSSELHRPEFMKISSTPESSQIISSYNQLKPEKDKPFHSNEIFEFKADKITFFKFMGKEAGGSDGTGLVLKSQNGNYHNFTSTWYDTDYSPSRGEFSYGNIIEGADIVILEDDSGMHSCKKMHIIQGDKIKSYKIECDSGGC